MCSVGYIDINNSIYFEIYRFFDAVMKYYLDEGYSTKDARDEAYDAIELRYNVKRDRARAILIGVNRNKDKIPSISNKIIQDNKRLAELIEIVNNGIINKGERA